MMTACYKHLFCLTA